jgi:hypothetical protein
MLKTGRDLLMKASGGWAISGGEDGLDGLMADRDSSRHRRLKSLPPSGPSPTGLWALSSSTWAARRSPEPIGPLDIGRMTFSAARAVRTSASSEAFPSMIATPCTVANWIVAWPRYKYKR